MKSLWRSVVKWRNLIRIHGIFRGSKKQKTKLLLFSEFLVFWNLFIMVQSIFLLNVYRKLNWLKNNELFTNFLIKSEAYPTLNKYTEHNFSTTPSQTLVISHIQQALTFDAICMFEHSTHTISVGEKVEIIKLFQHAFITAASDILSHLNFSLFTYVSLFACSVTGRNHQCLKFNFHFIKSCAVVAGDKQEEEVEQGEDVKKAEKIDNFSAYTRVDFFSLQLNTSSSLSLSRRTADCEVEKRRKKKKKKRSDMMSPSKLSFHDGHILNHQPPILNLSSYTASLTSSASPASGISHDSDGRSSSSSPNNLNSSMFGGYGHACSHCTSSFLTRDLLEKHELMHISNATMVSADFPFVFPSSFQPLNPFVRETFVREFIKVRKSAAKMLPFN